MWKYKASTILPFWAKDNANKPSKKVFDAWVNENMKEVSLTLNFMSFHNITLNCEFNGFKYIQIINTDNENDTRFYYITSINQTGATNSYKYNGVIDIYTTYTIGFIEDNLNVPFLFLRSHEYEKKCLQIDDENVLAIPKLYKNFYFQKKPFLHDEITNIWYGEKIGIKGNDLVNANKYYVFQNGVNGGYRFYPILSKTQDVEVSYSRPIKGALKSTYHFWNGRKNNELKQEIDSNLNTAIVNAYNEGEVVEYLYKPVVQGYIFPAESAWLGNWKEIPNVPYGTMPLDIRGETWFGNTAGAGLKGFNVYNYVLGNQFYGISAKNYTAASFGELDRMTDLARQFKVNIYQTSKEVTKINVKNSRTGLEILRRKQENINRFLGVYYLPHFLNFDKFDKDGDYIFVNIDPQGDYIKLFPIYDYSLSNITNKLNNPSYSTPYFLKWLNIKYFGNLINAEYRTNEQSQIYIGGKLFFTDTANIISKSDDLIDLNRSIINYPYQLPIGSDNYEKYVQANRNVTDTSFSILRQQQELAFAKSLTNLGLGALNTLTSTASSMASGNIGAPLEGMTSMLSQVSNTTFDIINQQNQIANEEKKIRAQYEQVKFTQGNTIQFSTIASASLSEYYDDDSGIQYDGVEVSDLDNNSLIQMNNYIFLNGYLNPKKDTLANRVNNNRPFNFIAIDAQILTSTINVKWDQLKYNNEVFNMIVNQLTNGLRIWNVSDITNIPEWDNDETWPNQPQDNGIKPPPPPSQTFNEVLPMLDNYPYLLSPSNTPPTCALSFYDTYMSVSFVDSKQEYNNKYDVSFKYGKELKDIEEITIDFKNVKDFYSPFPRDPSLSSSHFIVYIGTKHEQELKLKRINLINVNDAIKRQFQDKTYYYRYGISINRNFGNNIELYINEELWQ